jgi:hypothetical protein
MKVDLKRCMDLGLVRSIAPPIDFDAERRERNKLGMRKWRKENLEHYRAVNRQHQADYRRRKKGTSANLQV